MSFSQRYHRQTLFAPIGTEGQQKLADSRVLVVGCGALGAAHANLLARAGVGTLVLVDRDILEASNLQRQLLYDEAQVRARLPKAEAAKQRLQEINSSIRLEAHTLDLTADSIEALLENVDLVLDATDNFETRYLLNDACVKHGVPWIYGACVSSYGLSLTIRPGVTPCFRCVFEQAPAPGTSPTCDTAGVLGSIVTMVSSVQVTEAIKLLVGAEEQLRSGLLHMDVWQSRFQQLGMASPRPDCPTCGQHDFPYLEQSGQSSTHLCGRNTVQIRPAPGTTIDLVQLEKQLQPLGNVLRTPFLLTLQWEELELTVFPDGRTLVEGTNDLAVARSAVSKTIGM